MRREMISRALLHVLLFIATTPLVRAQEAIPKVATAYALTNVNVIQEPGVTIPNTTVLIEDGLIQAVGAKIPIPSHARVIRCDSMYLYPGFIEGISHTGIPAKERDNSADRGERNDDRVEDPGNPPNDKAGITPEKSAAEEFASTDKSVSDMRELGFTASHVVPRDGMLPGKGCVFLLGDGSANQLVVAENISMFAQFAPARRMYPGTTIGVMAKWRDLYREATYMSRHKAIFDNTPNGKPRPRYDKATEAMFDVVDGSLPVYFKVPDALDIHKALELQETLGFELALCEVDEAWNAMDAVKSSGAPLFITLDLPEEPKEKKKDEEEPLTAEQEAFEKRKAESLKQHLEQAGLIARSGAVMAFSTLDVKSRDFKSNLLRMIENGLNPDTALAALTTVPASTFGLDGRMGTITAGKMANLFVSNHPYFEKESQVKYVFVEGAMYEYEIEPAKQKKEKGEEGPAVDIKGKWSYEVEVMGQPYTGILTFEGDSDAYSGELLSDEDGKVSEMEEIEVNGRNVTFSITQDNSGMLLQFDFELEMTEEGFEGSVTVGNFGTFDIEGTRIPN